MAHKLGFCGKLCLPYDFSPQFPAKGIQAVHETQTGFLMAMFRPMVPLTHAIYVTRPVLNGEVLQFADLDSVEKVQAAYKAGAVSADCALDANPLVQPAFKNFDEDLLYVAERLRSNGYDSVIIFSQNGIGPDVQVGQREDGIVRNQEGVAYMHIHERQAYEQAQAIKQNPQGAQTTFCDHTHIFGVEAGVQYFAALQQALKDEPKVRNRSFKEAREIVGEYGHPLPAITIAQVVDPDKGIDNTIYFAHNDIGDKSQLFSQGRFSGTVRQTIEGVTNQHYNTTINDPTVWKATMQPTREFYQRIL